MNETRLPDAERLTALLRIVAVPILLVGEVYVPKPEPSEGRFFVVLAVFAIYAVVTLVVARWEIAPGPHWQRLAIADIAFAGALTYSSGGGFSQLRFASTWLLQSGHTKRPDPAATQAEAQLLRKSTIGSPPL